MDLSPQMGRKEKRTIAQASFDNQLFASRSHQLDLATEKTAKQADRHE
jgi:hypothetical protein